MADYELAFLGYAIIARHNYGNGFDPALGPGRMLEIVELFVQPDVRRGGIGSTMVQHAIGLARNDACVYVGVNVNVSTNNLAAWNFFSAQGFETTTVKAFTLGKWL